MSKTIVISGTSGGIGKVLAEGLQQKGYQVFGLSRSVPKNVAFQTIPTDITREDELTAAVEKVLETTGHIDVLINNAGKGMIGALEDVEKQEIEDLFNLNVISHVQAMKKVLPSMRDKNNGLIINVSSIASNSGLPFRAFYSASKASLDKITEAVRIELRHTHIQICTLNLGTIETSIARNRIESKVSDFYKERYNQCLESINNHKDVGLSPDGLVDFIEDLIQKKQVKPHYYYGDFMQKLSTKLKGLLPQIMFENMVAKYSKLS